MCLYSLGISGKSQVLLALVFTTRYLDLFTVFISTYNTVMKASLQNTHSLTHLGCVGQKHMMESIMIRVFCLSPANHNRCFAQPLIKQGCIVLH